jgi:N-acyl-D-amino-acid deacylase
MDESNVEKGLATDFIMVGSDGDGRSAEGPYSAGKPHPRNYGTFPRVLGHYSRDRQLFPLETAVAKMTGMPAARLGFKQRGLLRQGHFADITIFDPASVRDTATFANPHQYAAGINTVFVNGKATIWEGRHTRALPGKVLQRG